MAEIPQQCSNARLNSILLYLAQPELQQHLDTFPCSSGAVLLTARASKPPAHRFCEELRLSLALGSQQFFCNSFPVGIDLGPPAFTFQAASVYLQHLICRGEEQESRVTQANHGPCLGQNSISDLPVPHCVLLTAHRQNKGTSMRSLQF